MDEQILEAVRRVVYRWVNTSAFLTEDVLTGGTIVKVRTTNRFLPGDEVSIIDPNTQDGEPGLKILKVIDRTTLELATPIQTKHGFGPGKGSMIIKTWSGNFVQGLYLGDPDVIPFFPAVSIMGESKSSNWQALGLTKEDYRFQVAVYVQDDNTEDSYRQLLRLTKAIEHGMKKNIYPLVGDYITANVTADVQVDDAFIKVADTSQMYVDQELVLESVHLAEGLRVKCVVDSTTIQVYVPSSNQFLVSDDAKIIGLTRFIYNSWPADIKYGFIHKGSLVHGSTISWFAWEAEQQTTGGWQDTQLS